MTDLRTAAQQALEAMDELHRTGDTQVFDICHKKTTEALRAALAEPEQEPVAWLSTDCIGERYLCFSKPSDNDPVQPLYAAPPQRKPLVDPAEYDDAEVESDYE